MGKHLTKMQKISIFGLGYIGLPTAAILADRGYRVVGYDVNETVVAMVNNGEAHILEAGLGPLVSNGVQQGLLSATSSPENADIFIIAVPTPFDDGKKPNLSYIKNAASSIGPLLKKGDLVILESTVPVGGTDQLSQWLSDSNAELSFPHTHYEDSDVRVAYCPERAMPGNTLEELTCNARVVGGMSSKCSAVAKAFYASFVKPACYTTNAKTAELCKLAENSFRDVNIAFANELSIICESSGVNVWELIKLTNLHPRVNVLQPSAGVGGHCIAVDPWFIVASNPDDAELIRTARTVNDGKPKWVSRQVEAAVRDLLINPNNQIKESITIGFFGLSFKPNIEDIRESPAKIVIEEVAKMKLGKLLLAEPFIKNLPNDLTSVVELASPDEVYMNSDVVVYLVSHDKFQDLKKLPLGHRKVVDACGLAHSLF
jgi:UDP-N-acetyl-D-mannosaminuronic acid dehydrogenase